MINVTDEVLREYGSEDWTVPEFMEKINAAIAKIPASSMAKAIVSLEGGNDESARLVISCVRPETEAETAAREAREREWSAKAEERERDELDRLLIKYGR